MAPLRSTPPAIVCSAAAAAWATARPIRPAAPRMPMLVMRLYPSTAACLMAGMTAIRNIVVLTGAGVSAESGLATFRGPDGLWEGHRVQDVCTPEALRTDPRLVHDFYDARRAALAGAAPNPAHVALARLDAAWPGELLIITQNVDDLHE